MVYFKKESKKNKIEAVKERTEKYGFSIIFINCFKCVTLSNIGYLKNLQEYRQNAYMCILCVGRNVKVHYHINFTIKYRIFGFWLSLY